MFPWAPQAALAGHTAGRRARVAARLALSFLLLEDDHEVDWEVDWDRSEGLEPLATEPETPSYGAWPQRHRPSLGRGYRRASRRLGQPAPALQLCMVDVHATSGPAARARRRCEAPRSGIPPCRRAMGVSQFGRPDRGREL
jgi:hypothetical protein